VEFGVNILKNELLHKLIMKQLIFILLYIMKFFIS